MRGGIEFNTLQMQAHRITCIRNMVGFGALYSLIGPEKPTDAAAIYFDVQKEDCMAERVGFEPTVRFPARSLSRRVLSTAQSPLRGSCMVNRNRRFADSAIGLCAL